MSSPINVDWLASKLQNLPVFLYSVLGLCVCIALALVLFGCLLHQLWASLCHHIHHHHCFALLTKYLDFDIAWWCSSLSISIWCLNAVHVWVSISFSRFRRFLDITLLHWLNEFNVCVCVCIALIFSSSPEIFPTWSYLFSAVFCYLTGWLFPEYLHGTFQHLSFLAELLPYVFKIFFQVVDYFILFGKLLV